MTKTLSQAVLAFLLTIFICNADINDADNKINSQITSVATSFYDSSYSSLTTKNGNGFFVPIHGPTTLSKSKSKERLII